MTPVEHIILERKIKELRSYKSDDPKWAHAWSSGFTHGYYGLDAGWVNTDGLKPFYDMGRFDGEYYRQITIQMGYEDPYRW